MADLAPMEITNPPSLSPLSMSITSESDAGMFDFNFFEGLPVDTPRAVASNIKAIQAAVRRNFEHAYIVLEHVSPDIVEKIVDSTHLQVFRSTRLFYDADLRKLILKVVSGIHDSGSEAFSRMIDKQLMSLGIDEEVKFKGSGRVKDGPYSKEPDKSFFPCRNIPDRDNKWPTMVLEIGYSESLRRLRVDGRWWLGRSGGQVKIVILIAIDQTLPLIIVEKWENRAPVHDHSLRSPGLSPQKISDVTATLVNGIYVVTGEPIPISMDDILISSVPTGKSFLIGRDELKKLSKAIWEEQGLVPRPV